MLGMATLTMKKSSTPRNDAETITASTSQRRGSGRMLRIGSGSMTRLGMGRALGRATIGKVDVSILSSNPLQVSSRPQLSILRGSQENSLQRQQGGLW